MYSSRIAWWRRMLVVLPVALVISGSQLQAANAEPVNASAPVSAPAVEVTDSGASGDTTAISQAAAEYEAGDPVAAAELAEAASAVTAIPMTKTKGGGLKAESDDGAKVAVTSGGDVTMSAPGAPEIGIGVEGDPEATKVVDGALVQAGISPSTDIVTRATGEGVQMVVVLADAEAPSVIRFPIELPDAARMIQQLDGSVAVMAPVTQLVVPDSARNQLQDQITAILGERADMADLTAEQLARLDSIPLPRVARETVMRTVAIVEPAWAIDANGNSVESRYVVEEGLLKQLINTDQDTAFPVTADPNFDLSWWEWTVYGLGCLADLAAVVFVGAKMVKAFAKAEALVKASSRVFAAYKKLGERWDKVIDKIVQYVKDKRSLSKAQVEAVEDLFRWGGGTLMAVIGIDTCWGLFKRILWG